MKNTEKAPNRLFDKAVKEMKEDMVNRGLGAILWDLSTAGFHYMPEVTVGSGDKAEVESVMGLYLYNDKLYLVEESKSGVKLSDYYNRDTEVAPTVVTLTPDSAEDHLGNPTKQKGYTDKASGEEWLDIADCYFEALAER